MVVKNAILKLITYILNITRYIRDNMQKVDVAQKLNSKQYISFRIIGNLLKMEKNSIPSNLVNA